MTDLKRISGKSWGMRVLGILAWTVCLLTTASCSKDDDQEEKKTALLQAAYDYENLRIVVESYESAHQDPSSFTEESYAYFVQLLAMAKEALEKGVEENGEYAVLKNELSEARKGLTLSGWTPITDYLPQCSMLIIMSEENMPEMVEENDMVGAFYGDKCLGIAYPEKQPNGKYYFFLQVLQDSADEYNTDIRIVLKYHSALTNFVTRTGEMKYEDQRILGSYSDPYQPLWE